MTTLEPHRIRARVYYEDTDAGGIVYHSNYFKFAERGRTEYLRSLGYNHHEVRRRHNLMLVVAHATIDWKASGFLDDLLDIATEMVRCGNSSMTMRQVVARVEGDGRLTVLADISIVVVAVGEIGKPVRLPPQLRQIFGGQSEEAGK